jgi:hypothetical protein
MREPFIAGLALMCAFGAWAGVAKPVAMADLPTPVREAAEKAVAGGALKRIVRERENGQDIYSVETSNAGTTKEFMFAADGALLAEEEDVAFAELPASVRTAARDYFGGTNGLQASKESAKGVTSYEVEGKKAGTPMSLKFSPDGAMLAEEKDKD